ncbi:hypothetical protein ACHAXR_005099 [Thalassiosira sp. AJA248-18]
MAAETTYASILHRKTKGSLILTDRGLFFRSDGDNNGNNAAGSSTTATAARVVLPWNQVVKHQVSPTSHSKSLLKVISSTASSNNADPKKSSTSSVTFIFPNRNSLEGARRDISSRLSKGKHQQPSSNTKNKPQQQQQPNSNNRKRPRPNNESMPPTQTSHHKRQSTPPSTHYIIHDPLALIATRSSLLASDPALRAQHRLLVLDGIGTLSEEDFWETHSRLVANEYAKISGKTNRGMSSDIKSSLDLGISSSNKKSGGGGGGGGAKKKEGGSGGGGGGARAGGASGIVHLGVEEIRQIFIMYPAVHRAYEEKVPLELSEEQFWRKYLESEYFHRDRGRIGAHIGKVNERELIEQERFHRDRGRIGAHIGKVNERELIEQERVFGKKGDADGGDNKDGGGKNKKDDKEETMDEDEAKSRLAAAGTDDIFSRYDTKGHHHMSSSSGGGGGGGTLNRHHRHHHHHHRKLGTQIAVGQFDLASTNEVERGDRFLEGKDLHPPPEKDSAGSRVIDKYNRHWAIVLHPTESTAGVDLGRVAAKSARADALDKDKDDEDAKVNGGHDREMRRLIGFADADENDADFARGVGDDNEELVELHLRNVDAYTGKFGVSSSSDPSSPSKGGGGDGSDIKVHLQYAKYLAAQMRTDTELILREKTAGMAKGFCHAPTLKKPFLPDPKVGRRLLEALTNKMAADSKTEADVQQLAETLPAEFKTKLATFFRRATELLRHFFSLRSVFNENSDGNGGVGQSESQKERLTNIVKGMEKVHGEMYELTRNMPTMESKMFKPIMDQLDWAFKLHREDSSKSKGGFVTVAKGGFVPVAH